MHISSLIRSPSWLYYKLWTQNNLFHASFSRQRKLHQFRLCMSATVKAAGTELPNSHWFFSAGPSDCPEPCPEPSPQTPRAKSVCAIPVPVQCRTWVLLEGQGKDISGFKHTQVQRDGMVPWAGLGFALSCLANCSHITEWRLVIVSPSTQSEATTGRKGLSF